MPRAKVPLGRSSKRSCSMASICRAANLSCRAMSAIDRPSAARPFASSSPTPTPARASATSVLSVIFPALQLLVLARGGKAPPQLGRVAGFGNAFAELALDAQAEPQRLRRRLDEL